MLPPRRSEVPAQVEGAVPPLSGFWITRTIQSGTNGITAIAYAPDGRLFAGLSNGGLRVYGPNASGIYGWTSINASPGGLPSNWVTSLAVFNGDLWVGTSGSGVGVYDLNSGTWISYTVANSPLPHDTINRLTPGRSIPTAPITSGSAPTAARRNSRRAARALVEHHQHGRWSAEQYRV